jgi:hypothetical protein
MYFNNNNMMMTMTMMVMPSRGALDNTTSQVDFQIYYEDKRS